ncbi:DMT family transporter [Aestuariispira insulae]|uniref:Drug/metabolite transporter (DMT)-like permease n=1 Tax=Aestuariispira insulae TaxID=1461337 RepID=A0A3D9HW72_9PROT|nr:DMT family transporter [Aestuariispira insulae]RED53738.1 drug/metabolite transporter (DMT)-like permease [Aestuariispira insulae]
MAQMAEPEVESRSNIMKAAAWMAGTLLSFGAMAVGGRELAGEIPIFQTLLIRSLVGILVISCLIKLRDVALFRTHQPLRHLARNGFHYGGQYAWFYGIGVLPLAEVFAIEFTTPIWTALLAALFLGERLTPTRIIASLLGFTGIMMILRPGFEAISIGSMVVLGAALAFSASNTVTKMLVRTEAAATVIFYMTVMQAAFSLIPALTVWVPVEMHHWPWLVVVGVTAVSAHYCLSQALKVADAAVVLPFDFLRLPLIALIGFLFYQEAIDPFLAIGAGLIIIGNVNNIRAERKK